MGKRSDFKRRKHDAYDTPPEAVVPLLPHLPTEFAFAEPCAGACELAIHLVDLTGSSAIPTLLADIEPRCISVEQRDALAGGVPQNTDFIITNPPWTRQILHPLIDHFRKLRPTWLLLGAEFAHTKQAIPYLQFCHKIVSVGRVSWMQNGTSSLDSVAWYLFGRDEAQTMFYGRQP
jgi:hypothetical protein